MGAKKCWASKDTIRSEKTTHRTRGDFCRSYYPVRDMFLETGRPFRP